MYYFCSLQEPWKTNVFIPKYRDKLDPLRDLPRVQAALGNLLWWPKDPMPTPTVAFSSPGELVGQQPRTVAASCSQASCAVVPVCP